MATWQAVNIKSNAVELPKYDVTGEIVVMWSVALTTALANGDVILGPSMPFQGYLNAVTIDTDDLDSGSSLLFTVGYAGFPAKFMTASSVGQTGGIGSSNVAGTHGFNQVTAGLNTQILVTITAGAAVPVAGPMRIILTFTVDP